MNKNYCHICKSSTFQTKQITARLETGRTVKVFACERCYEQQKRNNLKHVHDPRPKVKREGICPKCLGKPLWDGRECAGCGEDHSHKEGYQNGGGK